MKGKNEYNSKFRKMFPQSFFSTFLSNQIRMLSTLLTKIRWGLQNIRNRAIFNKKYSFSLARKLLPLLVFVCIISHFLDQKSLTGTQILPPHGSNFHMEVFHLLKSSNRSKRKTYKPSAIFINSPDILQVLFNKNIWFSNIYFWSHRRLD